MYLQITSKCNMSCAHCCYSCSMRGKHADYNTVVDMISFARDYTEMISIGGGEPTLHPRFFDILKHCLTDFDYVWMATNGSQTEIMRRLRDIIYQEDYPECDCLEELGEEEYEEYGCLCHEKLTDDTIYQEDKLSVALSQDYFHDPIDNWVTDTWTHAANNGGGAHFEIRDVTKSINGVLAQGRGKRTGAGWSEDGCVCSDLMLKPDGKIRLCGCSRAPVIGDIWQGINEKWEKVIQGDKPLPNGKSYVDTNCAFGK